MSCGSPRAGSCLDRNHLPRHPLSPKRPPGLRLSHALSLWALSVSGQALTYPPVAGCFVLRPGAFQSRRRRTWLARPLCGAAHLAIRPTRSQCRRSLALRRRNEGPIGSHGETVCCARASTDRSGQVVTSPVARGRSTSHCSNSRSDHLTARPPMRTGVGNAPWRIGACSH